jgi:predicted HicB family RNase H-like nuclease
LKALSIRLPHDKFEKLAKEAKKQKRTLNAQVNYWLEQVVEEEKGKNEEE